MTTEQTSANGISITYEDRGAKGAPAILLVPALGLALACIYFGFDTSFTVGAADAAARSEEVPRHHDDEP